MKKYIIFDLDGTLIKSMQNSLKIVFDELKKIPGTDMELVRYVFTQTMGKPLKKQLNLIYPDKDNEEIEKITQQIYQRLSEQEPKFFPGTIQIIKKLCKNYKLFLSTGNSTFFAIKTLKKGGIKDCFEIILGSDKILKGPDHLEYFKNYTGDENFYQKAIYVGDGNSDREFAKLKNITFIHIGNDGKDKYEIKEIKYLLKLLKELS